LYFVVISFWYYSYYFPYCKLSEPLSEEEIVNKF
jgi:hypothetical protein